MNRNVLWVVIGLLTVGLIVAVKMKPQIAERLNPGPGIERPFADDWTSPGTMPPGSQPVTPPGPVVPGPRTYKEAVAITGSSNKPLLLFFTSRTCRPCQQMKIELAPSLPSVLPQLVWYEVDVEAEKDLVRKFGVTSTPTYIIINSQEQVLKKGGGYKNVSDFGAWLAAPYQQPAPVPPAAPPRDINPPVSPPSSPQLPPKRRQQPG